MSHHTAEAGFTSGYQTGTTGKESSGGDQGISSGGHSSTTRQKTVRDRNLGTIHGDLFTRPLNFDKRGELEGETSWTSGGVSGAPQEFRVNFVPVETFPETLIYQYHVQFEPDIDSKEFRQKILMQESVSKELGSFFIFDGMIMYLNREWDRERRLSGRHPQSGIPIEIRFKNSVCEGKPKQPHEPPQKTYLVPELCTPTGLTDDMRKDFRLMRALSHHTRLDPMKRAMSTKELINRLQASIECQALFDNWHFRLSDEIAGMIGRILPPERMLGSRNFEFTGQKAEWARELKRAGSFRTMHLSSWIIIYPRNEERMAVHFYERLGGLARQMDMGVAEPFAIPLDSTQPRDYQNGIQHALNTANNPNKPFCMIVILLPDDNKTRYDTLKKWLCTAYSIPSQCVQLKTLAGKPHAGGENKNFDSIVLKILLQMNCKMGGALWKVKIPLKETMIVGYDLYHDSTLKGKTVGACVSTYDKDFTEFFSQTRPHENPTQLGNNLMIFIRKALHRYQEANGQLPKRIILYRDGAGDGQIPYIRDQEVRLVKDACAEVVQQAGLPEDFKILLSFTIVTKKVNMRIFRVLQDTLINPDPGTVVDNTVTRPERFDFYLVPQYVNQGTVTPVCYNVVYDDTQLSPDRHQILAFKLSHMYFNWSGTIRVPAPCQYAHKLAFLVAQSIHQDPHEGLKDKLFFL
ncbi:hypothetical protein WR25_15017 [Diploscapter pachys]|uniref:Piwi domain-containing protein n=1 Tax=Diploscapter pachys TaxID=2018661 RepID=A0A2A2JA98_9BILA|nr:hypothetical protein WR25_15017 [Diploscapter pachys]